MAPARGLAGWPKNSLRLFLWRVLGSSLRPEIASALGVARLHWLWSDGFNTSHLSKKAGNLCGLPAFFTLCFLQNRRFKSALPPEGELRCSTGKIHAARLLAQAALKAKPQAPQGLGGELDGALHADPSFAGNPLTGTRPCPRHPLNSRRGCARRRRNTRFFQHIFRWKKQFPLKQAVLPAPLSPRPFSASCTGKPISLAPP